MTRSEPPHERADELLERARESAEYADREVVEAVDGAEQRHPRATKIARVGAAVLHEQSAERLGLAASGAAFWLVVSAFPTAIASLNLFGLVVSPKRVADVLGHLANAVPGSLGSLVSEQLTRVAATDNAKLSVSLAVSLTLAIWSASAGLYNLDRAIRVAYGLPPQTYLQARARAFVGAAVVVVLLGLGAFATSAVVAHSSVVIAVISGVAAFIAIATGVAALYRFAVGRHVAARALLPGAAASAAGVIVVTIGFGTYVALSRRFTAVYGAFGGVVIAMLAAYAAVYVVLLGAVLNRQLAGDV
jgi:membrane protein